MLRPAQWTRGAKLGGHPSGGAHPSVRPPCPKSVMPNQLSQGEGFPPAYNRGRRDARSLPAKSGPPAPYPAGYYPSLTFARAKSRRQTSMD